jgi:hypothetical protein
LDDALLPSSASIACIPFGASGCEISITTDPLDQTRPGTFTPLCHIGAYEAQGIHYQIYLPLVIQQSNNLRRKANGYEALDSIDLEEIKVDARRGIGVDPDAGCATHTERKCDRERTNQSNGKG